MAIGHVGHKAQIRLEIAWHRQVRPTLDCYAEKGVTAFVKDIGRYKKNPHDAKADQGAMAYSFQYFQQNVIPSRICPTLPGACPARQRVVEFPNPVSVDSAQIAIYGWARINPPGSPE